MSKALFAFYAEDKGFGPTLTPASIIHPIPGRTSD